ncbi:hypothetical protein [Lysobacter capsici]|uniref:hypothetical protein n=1 Tax=Lysobacter capsici TaxID=435897 RepID=UPI001C0057EA|nr:hypothetical protein [Lysobacter capsici]QWF17598.1 hypothetical protein KME82_02020 [Lysobacter capsici]
MTRTRLTLSLSVLIALSSPLAFADDGISKVNGSITVEASQRQGDLDTVNGSIKIGDSARVGKAETVNGSINVGNSSQTGGLETVNGSIRAGTNLTANGGIETVNGSIFVDRGGTVRGDLETVNGAIGLVDTDVTGGIETVNGDLTVGVDSHISGGVRYTKPNGIRLTKQRDPRVIIGPNARVDGALVFERDVKLYVHSTAKTGPIRGATAIAFNTATPPAE